MSTNTTVGLWEMVKNDFESLFPKDVFCSWFEPMECIHETEDDITLSVPSEFALIWVQDNYQNIIAKRLQMAAGRHIELILQVEAHPFSTEEKQTTEPREGLFSNKKDQSRFVPSDPTPQLEKYCINPRNSFENFVIGPSNQLAHAACTAVANAPARAYNPLFIYGETGLGKTHLMHAIAQQVLGTQPKARIVYVSTEKFINEFIRAIQENTLTKFRQLYRKVDLLLIDDIHFLSGKERSQEEFFHTFNDLFEAQKQIVLSSDRPAGEIAALKNRLLSRFQWGFVGDIQPPDFETRVAILTKKAAAMKLNLPPKILEFLAERVLRNVRRMEGALTRVAGYLAFTNNATIDLSSIENLLHDILQEERQLRITIEAIQQKTAEYYHIQKQDMQSRRRPANIAFPRQIAMYLSRLLTSHSLQEIGRSFGNRDHGTVIHACKTVENLMEQDDTIKRSVEYLQAHLKKNR